MEMTVHDDRSLLALQGPAAAETLAPLVDVDLSKMFFSNFAKLDIAGIPCYLTRTGCAALFGGCFVAKEQTAGMACDVVPLIVRMSSSNWAASTA